MTEIKSDIPLPTTSGRRGRAPEYPFASMKHEQHFDTEIRDGETPEAAVKRMRTVSGSYRRRHSASMAFVVRAVEHEETGEMVIRVWARNSKPPVKRIQDGLAEFFGKP